MSKFGWECYRRNEDYRDGYAQLFRRVIDNKELENFVRFKDVRTRSDLERWKRSNEEFERKFGPPPYMFKSDVEALRRLKPTQSYYRAPIHIPSGSALITVFCDDWLIRYPKDPKENFNDKKDRNLFVGLMNVVTISEHRYESQANAVFEALKKLKNLTIERDEFLKEIEDIPLAEAINMVWRDWEAIADRGRKLREGGEITFVMNANRSVDENIVPARAYLASIQRKRRRKRRSLLSSDGVDGQIWRTMIEIWDLMQGKDKDKSDKEFYSIVAGELSSRCGGNLTSKRVESDYKRIDGIIRECSEKKWPGAVLVRFRGIP